MESLLENINNSVNDPQFKLILTTLCNEIKARDTVIGNLKSKIESLEERISTQEQYTSKDCIIFENLPLIRSEKPLSHQVCDFLRDYLNFYTTPSNFKACHLLSKWDNIKKPPAVIVKFIYFHEKDAIFARKCKLARARNPENCQPIFMKERLPKAQKDLVKDVKSEGLVFTTTNCQVKVFTKHKTGTYKSVVVKNNDALQKIKGEAVKKVQPARNVNDNASTARVWFDFSNTPISTKEKHADGVMKRGRGSPQNRENSKLMRSNTEKDANGSLEALLEGDGRW